MKLLEKVKKSDYVGKNLSRFKMGMSYYTLFMSTVTAAMTMKFVYEDIQLEWIILAVPVLLIGTVFLGYFLDRMNVSTQDQRKSNEMTHRFLLTSDLKSQQFQMMQTQILLQAMQDLKNGNDVRLKSLEDAYKKYRENWKAPEEK
ncbi:MAG: hypothetical protein ACTSWL_02475 [Promethearchaeota archaeon]